MKAAKVESVSEAVRRRCCARLGGTLSATIRCARLGYGFDVPLLEGDHVTDEDGTGFVHTAPGHGREDFDIWMAKRRSCRSAASTPPSPSPSMATARFTKDAPGFEGKRVIDDKGNKGDANEAVIEALTEADALIARGRLKHQYPHSWRSKKPVIFRNTPQWFIAMDKPLRMPGEGGNADAARRCALKAIAETEFVPASGQNRLRGMIESRPDWVISRQRAWGVPITVFLHKETGEVIPSADVRQVGRADGAHPQGHGPRRAPTPGSSTGARERFLKGLVADPADWEQVTDILDVWFDFRLHARLHAGGPRGLPGPRRHHARARRRRRPRHVPGGLRPASRLVPVLAAGELRHARRARRSTSC